MSRSTKVKFETTTVHFVRPLLGFNDDTFELAQHDGLKEVSGGQIQHPQVGWIDDQEVDASLLQKLSFLVE